MLRRASAVLMAGLVSSAAQAAPPATQAAFTALKQQQHTARAVWRDARPALISGIRIATTGATPTQRALHFVRQHGALLAARDFEVSDVQTGEHTRVRLIQRHAGVPVADRSLVLTLDAAGAVVRVVNDAAPLVTVTPARIDAADAARRAYEHVHGAAAKVPPLTAQKRVFAAGSQGVEGYVIAVARGPFDVVEVRVNGADGTVFGVKAQRQW